MIPPAATYTCERCGVEFESEWSDEESLAESAATFGAMPKEDLAVVCDDCWKLMTDPVSMRALWRQS